MNARDGCRKYPEIGGANGAEGEPKPLCSTSLLMLSENVRVAFVDDLEVAP
jgi:hypothetical protein